MSYHYILLKLWLQNDYWKKVLKINSNLNVYWKKVFNYLNILNVTRKGKLEIGWIFQISGGSVFSEAQGVYVCCTDACVLLLWVGSWKRLKYFIKPNMCNNVLECRTTLMVQGHIVLELATNITSLSYMSFYTLNDIWWNYMYIYRSL